MSFKEDGNIQPSTSRGDEEIRTDEDEVKLKIDRVLRVTKLKKMDYVLKMEPFKLEPNDPGAKDSSDQLGAVTKESSIIPLDPRRENIPSVSLESSSNVGCLGDGKSLIRKDTVTLRVTIIAEPDKRDSGVVEIPPSCNDLPSCSSSPAKNSITATKHDKMRDRTSKVKSAVERHTVFHSRKRFKCWFCPTRFSQKPSLANHIRYAHCCPIKLSCEMCSKEFNHPYSFYLHMNVEHRALEISGKSSQSNEFVCEICSLKFARIEDVNDHRSSHSSESATNDLPSNEALDIKPVPEEVSSLRRYQCSQCSESFLLKRKYEKHIKVVHNSNAFKCSVCSRHFDCKYSYKIHVRSHFKSLAAPNSFVYSQQCDNCGFWFDRLDEMFQHQDVCKSAGKMSGVLYR